MCKGHGINYLLNLLPVDEECEISVWQPLLLGYIKHFHKRRLYWIYI